MTTNYMQVIGPPIPITYVLTSGYFNCLHGGHIECFNKARALGQHLTVIVNNDYQRMLKGSKEFQKEDERELIVKNIKAVDATFLSIDSDLTVCESIRSIYDQYRSISHKDNKFIFAKGGDRFIGNVPEVAICKELGIQIIDGLGSKIQSSSWLLNK